jgi:hypothetical protein
VKIRLAAVNAVSIWLAGLNDRVQFKGLSGVQRSERIGSAYLEDSIREDHPAEGGTS